MNRRLLSFLIPTYNRADLLDISLEELTCYIDEYQFEIIICDNASIDNTKQVVEKWTKKYPFIKYFRQETNVGYDRNVFSAFNMASSDYIWLIGDSITIVNEKIPQIIELLSLSEYEALIVNRYNVVENIPTQIFTNLSIVLLNLGWRMTDLSSTIVSSKFVIDQNFTRYFDTDFVHLGMFFEYLKDIQNFKIYWLSDNCTEKIKINSKILTWNSKTFEIFGLKWFALIMSLPNQISVNDKLKCIADHDYYMKVFGVKFLLYLKMNKWLKFNIIRKYKNILPFVTITPNWIMYSICLIPSFLIRFGFKTKKFINNLC